MMKRIIDAAARRRWPLTILAFITILGPLVYVRPDGEGTNIAAVVLVLAAIALIFLLAVNLSGRDPDADARALDVAPDPLSAALFARWMRRSKHFRFVGGLCGAILGLAFADGSLAPLVVGLLAGVAFGGAAAEVHSFRGRPRSARSADITARHMGDYVTPTDTFALAVIAAAAMCLMVVAVTTGAGRWGLFWSAMAALVAVAAATAMRWAVVVRRRPALSDDLRRADDVMRRLAATQGFTRPAIAFALVMLSQGLATFGNSTTLTVAVLVLWMLAIAWYVASRQSRANLRALIGS